MVIIVTSRSNPAGIIGHCSDVRRLNVALSRARCHLIIIADVAVRNLGKLELLPFFSQFFKKNIFSQ